MSKECPSVAACSVNLTLQQFADAALQRERLNNKSKDRAHREAKLPVLRSLAKSLSSSFKKKGHDLAKTLAAESDNRDASDGFAPPPSTPLDRSLQGSLQQLDSSQAQSSEQLKDDFKERDAVAAHSGLQEKSLHGDENDHNQEATASAKGPTHLGGRHRLAVVKPAPGQIHHDAAHMLWLKTVARVSHPTSGHAAEGVASPQVALPQTEVDVCLADEQADEAAEGTAPHAMIHKRNCSQTAEQIHNCLSVSYSSPYMQAPEHRSSACSTHLPAHPLIHPYTHPASLTPAHRYFWLLTTSPITPALLRQL